MISGFDPGALLARSYVLPRGPRVCLRLVRARDREGVRRLFERQGLDPDELELARLTRVDPRRRLVICATALIGSAETVVGIGAIGLLDGERARAAEVEAEAEAGPELVLVDEHATEGLRELLSEALVGRAQALTHGRTMARARRRAA